MGQTGEDWGRLRNEMEDFGLDWGTLGKAVRSLFCLFLSGPFTQFLLYDCHILYHVFKYHFESDQPGLSYRWTPTLKKK